MIERALSAKNAIDKEGARIKIINMSSLTDINIDALLDYTQGVNTGNSGRSLNIWRYWWNCK